MQLLMFTYGDTSYNLLGIIICIKQRLRDIVDDTWALIELISENSDFWYLERQRTTTTNHQAVIACARYLSLGSSTVKDSNCSSEVLPDRSPFGLRNNFSEIWPWRGLIYRLRMGRLSGQAIEREPRAQILSGLKNTRREKELILFSARVSRMVDKSLAIPGSRRSPIWKA